MLKFSKYGKQHILEWNFLPKNMNGKYFEKIYVKTVISVQQYSLLSNFI